MGIFSKASIVDLDRKAKLPRGFGFVVFGLFALGLFSSSRSFADMDFAKRQQERKSSRWTLSDWFETKKRISDQNSWLSVNHANQVPIDGSLTISQDAERLGATFDFYMKWLGFRLRHEYPVSYIPGSVSSELGGARSQAHLQMRLLGNSIQDTNIVLRGGVDYDDVQGVTGYNGYYLGWNLEPEVQIYFAKFLGVWGSWKYRFTAKPADARNLSIGGNSWKAAAFIEVSAIRIEAGYQSRVWDFKNSTPASERRLQTNSLFGGIRFFY